MNTEIVKLKVKRIVEDAVIPSCSKDRDAGYDCVAIDNGIWSPDRTFIEYRTGIALELPDGYHVEIFPRSSISNYDLVLANSIGLIDNGYRGEIKFRFKYIQRYQLNRILYVKGDKIGQIVIRKTYNADVEVVETLSDTQRGVGGWGSSGQ